MKLSLLAAAPLVVASTALARSPLKRGLTTDTCANLDVDLVFSDTEVDGKPYVAGHIDIGLCISHVKDFVPHFSVTEAATKVVGVDKVASAVIDLIKQAGVQCTYPPHALPSVSSADACSFVCMDGFQPLPANHPSSCSCPSHLRECNGRCGHFHADCTTTAPPSRQENDPKCAEGLTMCGVPDGMAGEAYKCIDVTSDASTCGGCVKPSPFGSPSKMGVNCRAIPNVGKVACVNNACVVRTCQSGFTVLGDNRECVAGPRARGIPNPSPFGSLETFVERINVFGSGSIVGGMPGPVIAGPLGASLPVNGKVARDCSVTRSQC